MRKESKKWSGAKLAYKSLKSVWPLDQGHKTEFISNAVNGKQWDSTGHRSGMSLLEFMPPVRRELANVKTHLSDQDGMTLPWCLQKPWMMVTQDDIQVVRRSWDLNGSHSKAGAIRPSQRAVEYGGTVREGALGVKAQGSGDQRTGLGVHLRAGWLLLSSLIQSPPGGSAAPRSSTLSFSWQLM